MARSPNACQPVLRRLLGGGVAAANDDATVLDPALLAQRVVGIDQGATIGVAEQCDIDPLVPILPPLLPIVPAALAIGEHQGRNRRIIADLLDQVGPWPRQHEIGQVALDQCAECGGLSDRHRRRRQRDPDQRPRDIECHRAREIFLRVDIPGRGAGQRHRWSVVELDFDRLTAIWTEPPGEAAAARRPQCQRWRRQVLPTAAAGGDDPMQQQVDQVGVFREGRRRAAETVAQQLQDGAIGRAKIFRRRILQLPRGQRPVGAPAARFENADHAQIENEGQTRPRRVIETIGKLIRSRRRAGRLTQLVQPAADRADERIALGSLDRRRILPAPPAAPPPRACSSTRPGSCIGPTARRDCPSRYRRRRDTAAAASPGPTRSGVGRPGRPAGRAPRRGAGRDVPCRSHREDSAGCRFRRTETRRSEKAEPRRMENRATARPFREWEGVPPISAVAGCCQAPPGTPCALARPIPFPRRRTPTLAES